MLKAYVRSEEVLGRSSSNKMIRQLLLPTVRKLAFSLHQRHRLKLSVDDLTRVLEEARGNRGYSLDEMDGTLRQSGLVVGDDESIWFVHDYLNDYLCSEYLDSSYADRQLSPADVAALASDAWWRASIRLFLEKAAISVDDLLLFLAAGVDRWVRYEAGAVLGVRGDPRPGRTVTIPGGTFRMGRNNGHASEQPVHDLDVPAFEIDVYPVTNEQYREFLSDTSHSAPPHWRNGEWPRGTANHAVTNVSWHDALAYAHWLGKRLPTEAEWEKAASWADDGVKSLYPWGDRFDPSFLNSDVAATDWVGDYSRGRLPRRREPLQRARPLRRRLGVDLESVRTLPLRPGRWPRGPRTPRPAGRPRRVLDVRKSRVLDHD